MVGSCLNPTIEGCKFRKSIGHHLYYPKREYETELEKAFRELPENRIQICACAEWLIHNTMRNPEKPSLEQMITSLTVSLEQVQHTQE